jgi:hypothetical protein
VRLCPAVPAPGPAETAAMSETFATSAGFALAAPGARDAVLLGEHQTRVNATFSTCLVDDHAGQMRGVNTKINQSTIAERRTRPRSGALRTIKIGAGSSVIVTDVIGKPLRSASAAMRLTASQSASGTRSLANVSRGGGAGTRAKRSRSQSASLRRRPPVWVRRIKLPSGSQP